MIDIKELSIGNYFRVAHEGLCIKKGTIVKINGIDAENKFMKKGLVGAIYCHPLDEDQLDGGIWLAYLEPIEITPEILEKNGWVIMGGNLYSCSYKDAEFGEQVLDVIDMDDHWDLSINDLFVIEIKYVHQLQNALTLCGIDKEIELL